ncbi:MAG: trypsin-like peptidase domain-containing protein, partial [Chloroflexota bacterium]
MMRKPFARLIACLLVPCLLGLAAPARASLDPAARESVFPAVVQVGILIEDGAGSRSRISLGSGAVVSPQGLVLTNYHVVDEQSGDADLARIAPGYVRVPGVFTISISDGRNPPVLQFLASVAAADPALDLAVLRIDRDSSQQPVDPASLNLPTLRLGTVRQIDIGDPLHVIGFPAIGSGSLTYTDGIVSGFLYEDGIDGVAWINTDALMSGGVSGGAAVDDAGALAGVPTSGTPLDCRPGDTNGDGVEDGRDIGCVPTGGSLGQVRPIDLALPILRSVDPSLAPASGPDPAAAAPAPVTDLATAAACAQRADWRCASRIYRLAWQANPGDPAVAAPFSDALLGLGRTEEDGGQLGAARDAYAEAAAVDPA